MFDETVGSTDGAEVKVKKAEKLAKDKLPTAERRSCERFLHDLQKVSLTHRRVPEVKPEVLAGLVRANEVAIRDYYRAAMKALGDL